MEEIQPQWKKASMSRIFTPNTRLITFYHYYRRTESLFQIYVNLIIAYIVITA